MARNYRQEYLARLARRPGVSAREATGGIRRGDILRALRDPLHHERFIRQHHAAIVTVAGELAGVTIQLRQVSDAVAAGETPVLAVMPDYLTGVEGRANGRFLTIEEARHYCRPITPSICAIVPDEDYKRGYRMGLCYDKRGRDLLSQIDLRHYELELALSAGIGRRAA